MTYHTYRDEAQERAGIDRWLLDIPEPDDPEILHCEHCREPYTEDDGHCQNPHCYCEHCGEPIPETLTDDAHCTNGCEGDECVRQWWITYFDTKDHDAWRDMPIVSGEKVYSNR